MNIKDLFSFANKQLNAKCFNATKNAILLNIATKRGIQNYTDIMNYNTNEQVY